MATLAFVGNCQAHAFGDLVRVFCPELTVVWAGHFRKYPARGLFGARKLKPCDYVFVQRNVVPRDSLANLPGEKITFPRLSFRGFHPDAIALRKGVETLASPFGGHHSLIAYAAYRCGYAPEQARQLFNGEIYDKLGYYDVFAAERQRMLRECAACGIDAEAMFQRWCRQGCFMHTAVHPKLVVVGEIAGALLEKIGVASDAAAAPNYLPDTLLGRSVWPVYEEIAERLGVAGSYLFAKPVAKEARQDLQPLDDFLAEMFRIYRVADTANVATVGVTPERLNEVEHILTAYLERPAGLRAENARPAAPPATVPSEPKPSNPYADARDYQFWRRAVSNTPRERIDPVIEPRFRIGKRDRLASAGSCFAQHIARALQTGGYDYFITESAPRTLSKEAASARNYGVFSARYGNIYTARQLVQLFDRAYGTFTPAETAWRRPDGRFVDPFRPQVEPGGHATEREVRDAQSEHLAHVRRLFEQLDVFVFTLGLTEGWQAVGDGAAFPLAPGVAGGAFDPERHRFVNYTAAEIEADLRVFIGKLKAVNAAARILFTVSPVPLIATFENQSVITATCFSKSALRVAADAVYRAFPFVDYFPSYEIITGPFSRGDYFGADCREITGQGVDHAMRLFLAHYGADGGGAVEASGDEEDALVALVCDEEALDRQIA